MASQLSSIRAILFSTAVFLVGNGLIGTLTPMRAHLEGFSDLAIGAIGSCFYAGFVIGCLAGPRLLARAGHIRTFAVAAAAIAAAVLLQPIFTSPGVWFVARAIIGAGSAGIFMALESWLNDRATNDTRGRILSYYVMINLTALILGQWLLLLAPATSFKLFSLGAILYCLCLVPVGLTRQPQPASSAIIHVRLRRLVRISPVGAAGCITVGLANGAFWTLAPVYAQSLGFDTHALALFISVFIAGGALIQWPLGRFSDRMDRRWIIAAVCAIASLAAIALALLGQHPLQAPFAFYAFVFVFGAAMLPLYSISIAHANDRLPRAEFVEASAGLLLINALASIAGPLLASFATSLAGSPALFFYTAAVDATMVAFTVARIRLRKAPREETREPFEPVAQQGSAAALPLDPRAPEQKEQAGLAETP